MVVVSLVDAVPQMAAGSKCRLEVCITKWPHSNNAGEAISSSSRTTNRALVHFLQPVVVAIISSCRVHNSHLFSAMQVELDATNAASKASISNNSSCLVKLHLLASKAHRVVRARAPVLFSCSSMQLQ